MPVVTIYAKPGCHLCEEAHEVLEGLRAEREFELREVDVTLDPVLFARYGERIPVVALDGRELFEYFVDPVALRERLDRVEP
ncbi:MAG TPA: glutaredoxin family protein [Thermoleophilaceae bacterium]|jgi:glutaredoxin